MQKGIGAVRVVILILTLISFGDCNVSNLDVAKYTGSLALDGLGASGAVQLAQTGVPRLLSYFSSDAVASTVGKQGFQRVGQVGSALFELESTAEIVVRPAIKGFGQNTLAQGIKQGLNFADDAGQKLLPQFSQSTIDDVINSSLRSRGQTNELLRAFDKKIGHAASGGYNSAFNNLTKSNEGLTSFIRKTLSNPNQTFIGNKVVDAYNPLGQGLRFEKGTNRFIGFLEGALR